MNAVGIDVSKGKSMVAIMRPFGEIVSAPFEIKHTASDIHSLVELSAVSVCPGLSGIPHHGVRRHLCCAGTEHLCRQ